MEPLRYRVTLRQLAPALVFGTGISILGIAVCVAAWLALGRIPGQALLYGISFPVIGFLMPVLVAGNETVADEYGITTRRWYQGRVLYPWHEIASIESTMSPMRIVVRMRNRRRVWLPAPLRLFPAGSASPDAVSMQGDARDLRRYGRAHGWRG